MKNGLKTKIIRIPQKVPVLRKVGYAPVAKDVTDLVF